MFAVQKEANVVIRDQMREQLRNKPYGFLATYAWLQEVTGSDVRECRNNVYAVIRDLQKHDHRTLENVMRQGYRIAEPKDHERLTVRQKTFATRRMRKAQSIASSTDRTRLTPEEDRRLTDVEVHISRIMQVLGRHGKSIETLEHKVQVSQTDMEMRLSRLESVFGRSALPSAEAMSNA